MKNKNPKSPLTDSNSELSTKPQSQLMRQDAPHYYEVKIPNHPNGVPQMHLMLRVFWKNIQSNHVEDLSSSTANC